jgi:single-strand DNA-binding protein
MRAQGFTSLWERSFGMASFNRVILVGNVTRDPELRYISSGTAVTDVGLAVNDRRKNAAGEWVEETTFVDVTLWGRTAEVAGEYVTKGSPLLIEGRLKLDTWEKDGKKNSKLRVVCDRMQLLSSRSDAGGRGRGTRPGGGQEAGNADPSYESGDYESAGKSVGSGDSYVGDDDIPF